MPLTALLDVMNALASFEFQFRNPLRGDSLPVGLKFPWLQMLGDWPESLYDELVAESRALALRGQNENLKDEFEVRQLQIGGEPRTLRSPLKVRVNSTMDEVVWEVPDLRIYASGETDADALAALEDQLTILAEDYLHETDSKLTLGGRRFRDRLRAILGE